MTLLVDIFIVGKLMKVKKVNVVVIAEAVWRGEKSCPANRKRYFFRIVTYFSFIIFAFEKMAGTRSGGGD